MRDAGSVFFQDRQNKDVLSWDQSRGSVHVSSASLLWREVDNIPPPTTVRSEQANV